MECYKRYSIPPPMPTNHVRKVCLQEILSLAATPSPASSLGYSREAEERYRQIRQQRRHQDPPSFRNAQLLSHRLTRITQSVDNQVADVVSRSEENGMLQTVFYGPSDAHQSRPKSLPRNPAKQRSDIAAIAASYKSVEDIYGVMDNRKDGGPRVMSVLPISPSLSHNTAVAAAPLSTRRQYSLRLESFHLTVDNSEVLDEENIGDDESGAGSDVPNQDENDKSNPDSTSKAMIATIGIYKNWISPLLPPACRFVPTCSRYGVQAIEEFGPTKGVILTAWRLLRCSPIGGKGYDPPKWPPVPYWYSSY
eukprot:CAMPEP_0113522122 /NCGR_PEP_ID=MMETSP0014_2-20120614/45021_1 /TAXON_ID=2857 /ORGANISM="Nitzschia sp." /LENGTH=307 /DNA_ID=CAMNT_0000420159 /DNA_START=214 /DNA_END=1137 /DNA_ORIENTATION=- /assembly_acc=CAM_ASM_000159